MARYSPFPPFSLEESLAIAKVIWENNSGKPMRRLTIFDALKRSPSSGAGRQLVTSSSGYGLTQGSYAAEVLQLTERGQAITEKNDPQAKIDAVMAVEIFAAFFEHYKNATVPATAAASDFLKSQSVPDQSVESCLEILLECGEYVSLIQEISGVKRIVSVEHALETLSKRQPMAKMPTVTPPHQPEKDRTGIETPIVNQEIKQVTDSPTVHIDIQIHIDANAKPEQIEKIFESMAKYLYKK